jgi:cell division protein FtsB
VNYQDLINIGAGGLLAVLGWFARQLWDAVKSLQGDMSKLREEIAKDYTRRDDFKELATEIRQMFREISDKLDKKADK